MTAIQNTERKSVTGSALLQRNHLEINKIPLIMGFKVNL